MTSRSGRSSPAPTEAEHNQTYYEVLKVGRTATEDEIKKSYRELVQIWHPDLNRNNAGTAQNKTQAINEAYRHLINSQSRLKYDQMLKRQKQRLLELNRNNKSSDTASSLLKQFLVWLKSGDQNNGR